MLFRWSSLVLVVVLAAVSHAQTAQVGADREARGAKKMLVEYLHYRPAKWEKELVTEHEADFPNEGGLLYLYLRNVSEEPQSLRFWRLNGQDESYWRLNHLIAWDRLYDRELQPGQLTVLEINGKTKDFAPGNDVKFSFVAGTWQPVLNHRGVMQESAVRISYIRVWPDLKRLTVHLRANNAQDFTLTSLGVEGAEATLGAVSLAPGAAIATVELAAPLSLGQLLVVKTAVKQGETELPVYAHRRAHPDFFPIGVWSMKEENHEDLMRMHVETGVLGGDASDGYYTWGVPKGLRNMVHTGVPTRVDQVRSLKDKPSILCWMIQDEPDWSIPANIMLHTDTELRQYDLSKPTFITLCRNIKFMEYGPIADIPCQDHYSVTAPSSSIWPKPYGTRLEETAWYTRDLKYASEPKPIWIWSQGIADWGERPKRTSPTPNELAAQLVLNLGRGAKGILWFNYSTELAQKWPDARDAMRDWGRVMSVLREDLLDADVWDGASASEGVDIAALLGRDRVLAGLTNTRYEIHPEAYPFTPHEQVSVRLPKPAFPVAVAVRITPDGIVDLPLAESGAQLEVSFGPLEATGMLALLPDAAAAEAYRTAFQQARERE